MFENCFSLTLDLTQRYLHFSLSFEVLLGRLLGEAGPKGIFCGVCSFPMLPSRWNKLLVIGVCVNVWRVTFGANQTKLH